MEFADQGLVLKWSELAEGSTGALRRVLVEAGPGASAHDVLRLVYSVDGGPERAVRGWPLGRDPATGVQSYAADLPSLCGGDMIWRPVLTHQGRDIDPGPLQPGRTEGLLAQLPELEPEAPASEAPAAAPPAAAPKLKHLAHFIVPFSADFDPVGATPDGVRLHFSIKSGGRVEGPDLRGDLLAKGGDWMRVRPDGIGIVDATALIQPDTGGGLIMLHETGICDFGTHGFEALAQGHLPPEAPVSLTPRYLTANPDYTWLNRVQGFAMGRAHLADVTLRYDVYCADRGADG